MVWPCVAEGFVDPADKVLHQCILPLLGARCDPDYHGYQRACDLVRRKDLNLLGQRIDLAGEALDASIEVAPVFREVLDQAQYTG